MEKNTVLAVVLSSVIIFTWLLFVQPKLFPPEAEQDAGQRTETEAPVQVTPVQSAQPSAVQPVEDVQTEVQDAALSDASTEETAAETTLPPVPETEERIIIETDIIRAVLTSAGGDLVSFKLKEHNDKGEMVEMILPSVFEDGSEKENHAFTIAFGGIDTQPAAVNFSVSRPSPLSVEFSREFSMAGSTETFTLTKRYEFRNGEYMFQLTVSVSGTAPLNFGNAAYTLGFGPQIGPGFQKLDNRYEYRHYYSLVNGKRNNVKLNTPVDSRFTWASIAGKYFTAIVIPDTSYTLTFSDKSEPGIPSASRMYLTRPPLSTGANSDVFHFYLGPKNQDNLGRYDTGDNSFRLRELDFTKAASTSGILGPLETLLKWLLKVCYKLVHNYGGAIILLTLMVKLMLFPLTKKSSEASIKMQALAPKIKELQTKYKGNPAKMNAELGALYKKEGHNPMSGCLPLVIQMPLLFAMYNLFNNHFDLRGAMFIPGWIPDLSLPESVMQFGSPLPLVGWDSLRLLPFIYVGSQLLYGVATRTPEQQGNPSMKIMLYVMPIMFFFILYNVPSGLLVFWIFSNVFTLIQQVILNKYMAAKRPVVVEEERDTVIAPRRKKKR
ncbi:MAG: membrane protein insertase YidC [Treponema sp.]|nr:membrane protein insertase YidC [Treponema sp.]